MVISDSSDDEWNDDDAGIYETEEVIEPVHLKCLFCSDTFIDINLHWQHCSDAHDFHISSLMLKLNLDSIDYIKLINHTREHQTEAKVLMQVEDNSLFSDDKYMFPSDPNDQLLLFDIETYNEGKSEDIKTTTTQLYNSNDSMLELRNQVSRYRNTVETLKNNLERSVQEIETLKKLSNERLLSSIEGTTNHSSYDPSKTSGPIERLTAYEDSAYAAGYAHFSIHQEMLQDKVRTSSYMDAIVKNKDSFKDKIVLDIGCGTGILSMFAAKSGAKHVYGIDMSDIAYVAKDITMENGLSDKITIIKGRMEDIVLPVDKVDIIVSEWMGFFLLFESMLDTVLWARDKYLVEGGVILPNRCKMYMCAVGDQEGYKRDVAYWDDVYGFKMTSLRKTIVEDTQVDSLKPELLISSPVCFKEIDILTVQIKDLDFNENFHLTIDKSGEMTSILSYFDISFDLLPEKVFFSTSPQNKTTHWKQTIFLMKNKLQVQKDEKIDCILKCKKNIKDPRALDINISIKGSKFKYIMQ